MSWRNLLKSRRQGPRAQQSKQDASRGGQGDGWGDHRLKTVFALGASPAVAVILMFGVISLLGDLVYEGARGANSQYFALLGVSAAQIGLVFGLGEFLGYFVRLFAGVLADRSGRHWPFMLAGYSLLLSVPLLGLTQNWNGVVVLVLMERLGKALRNPSKDTLLSGVAAGDPSDADKPGRIGVGLAFGIQEALDQLGAFGGPLIFTLVFALAGSASLAEYQLGYRLLIIPFILLILFVAFAWRKVSAAALLPDHRPAAARGYQSQKLQPVFWLYTAFTFFATLGFVNFSLVGYHLKSQGLLADGHITLLYSAAMAVDALVALLAGRSYDRLKHRRGGGRMNGSGGLALLIFIPVASVLLPVLTLSRYVILIVLGMLVFGAILGFHETIMRSAIADLTPFHKRGTSYGIFNAGYGLALLGGAALMGWFYDLGQNTWIVGLVLLAEAAALYFYYKMHGALKNK